MPLKTTICLITLMLAAVSCSAGHAPQDPHSTDATSFSDAPCAIGPIANVAIPQAKPGLRPAAVNAGSFHTKWPIKHVVFIMKENRSFDQFFGAFPGANGTSTGMVNGKQVNLRDCIPQKLMRDILHDYPTALKSWNHGAMDGFAATPFAREYAYSRAAPSDIPNYWHWASDFTLSDNFFASAMGPSYPNHLFGISAQSAGTHDNPVQNSMGKNYMRRSSRGLAKSWGCDIPKGAYVLVDHGKGRITKEWPCWDIPTLGDRLNEARVPWAYYGATKYQAGYIWDAYSYIRHMRFTSQWEQHVFPVRQLVPDIQDGRLPPVTWVTPEFWLSDHPDVNLCTSENWTTTVIDAIMKSPMWKDTAIFLTWDDWGGLYDHVPPPQIDRFGLGFRVPLIVLSPYSKEGFIDHSRGEFSSVLGFIEENWGLEPLTQRDAHADDLSQLFDFSQPPRSPDPLPLRTDCQMSAPRPP